MYMFFILVTPELFVKAYIVLLISSSNSYVMDRVLNYNDNGEFFPSTKF